MKKKFYKKTVIKWVMVLTVFIILTIITTSFFLYNWYASDNITLYSKMAESTLDNASKATETLDQSIKSVGFLAIRNNDYSDMIHRSNLDAWLDGNLRLKIQNLIFTNSVIYSAYLVNEKADWVIGSPSYDWIQAGSYSDSINKLIGSQKEDAVIRINTHKAQINEVNNKPQVDNVVSYVFYLTRQSNIDDSFFIINIKQSAIVKQLDNVNNLNDSNVIVTDKSGQVVLSKDPGQLYKSYGDKDFMKRVLVSKESFGYFEYADDSGKSIVTFVKSDKLDYCFISITPYEIARKTSIALRNRTIVLSLIIFLIGFAVALAIALYFNSPLKKLVKKYATIDNPGNLKDSIKYENEYEILDKLIEQNYKKAVSLDGFVNDNIPIIKQDYLKKMLKGKIKIKNEYSKERLTDIGVNLSFDSYQVICLAFNDTEDLEKTSSEMLTVRQKICKIAGDFMRLVCNYETVWEMNDETAVVLLNYSKSSPDINDRIIQACSSIQEYSQNNLGVKLTIAIGKSEINGVNHSYLNAMELLNYRLKYGEGAIITQERVAGDIAANDLFPEDEESQLLQNLRSLSPDGSCECVRGIIKKFYNYNINDIHRAVDHILYSTFQVVREMIKNRDVTSEIDFYYTYERLVRYKTLQEMEDNLVSFYQSIIRDVRKILDRSDNGHNEIIGKVIDFLKKNYMNPSISLDYVAKFANLNPAYLGKIFKDSTGIPFPEYVNKLRLDMAKELLANTNESINRISSLVGFNSTTYFVTCFKKYIGVTPAKFR